MLVTDHGVRQRTPGTILASVVAVLLDVPSLRRSPGEGASKPTVSMETWAVSGDVGRRLQHA